MSHISIKEIPKAERPYEKLFKKGAQNLENSELIAVLIRNGTTSSSALEVSRGILEHPLVNNKLENLHRLTLNDLCKINGLGKVKSAQLLSAVELSKRLSKAKAFNEFLFTEPKAIADYYMEDMRHLNHEKVIVCFLNARGGYLGDKEVFKGTVNASLASPREVYIEALKHEAASIIFLHNHPSGDPNPSKEDWLLTERLVKAGNIIQIPLVDHIIIGNLVYFSFRESKAIFKL